MTKITMVGTTILIVAAAISISAVVSSDHSRPSQSTMEHRVDRLEQDVGHLEQRVVRLENVLAEVLSVQTAASGKSAEEKAATAATKPPEELPVSVAVPQDPSVQARPAKHKPVARHPASQGSEYPQMKSPYPWTGWENPAPGQQ